MTAKELHKLFKQLQKIENNLVTIKGEEYATASDRFRNFKNMIHLQVPPNTPEAAAWNVMAKHLEASMFGLELLDAGKGPDMGFWYEKLGDIRIYCALILGMLQERADNAEKLTKSLQDLHRPVQDASFV